MQTRPNNSPHGACTILMVTMTLSWACVGTHAGTGLAKFVPTPEAKEWEVVPGGRYEVGGLARFLYGSDYRDLWLAPLVVPVLNLDSVGGGITPFRTGGFGQSVTLHFHGNDGRRYVVRSVDKDPTKRLLPDLEGTFVEDVIQDQISALHPTAALVVDPLLDATGILHASHTLVVIPDDPRLGEFREEYAGMLGMLVLHPEEGPDHVPGFAGSTRINGSENFFDHLEEGPCDRIDARAMLKARLVDMIIGDKDRHEGQWRWASFPEETGECRRWVPIPEDRDQAFIDFDGFVMFVTSLARPQQITFEDSYPSIVGLTFNAWEIDRELLNELDRSAWREVVAEVQANLTDEVIASAVRRLPPSHYALSGPMLEGALKARRDALGQAADEYYRLINRWVEIKATDVDEVATFTHADDGMLQVEIGERGGTTEIMAGAPYYTRVFDPNETREVRVYLRGGDDVGIVDGADGRITVRIVGGGSDDVMRNRSLAGARRTKFYDDRGDNIFDPGVGAEVDEREFDRPPSADLAHQFALDWGGRTLMFPLVSFSPDIGLLVGASMSAQRFGFRKTPFAVRHQLNAALATSIQEPYLSYSLRLNDVSARTDFKIEIEYSGLEIVRYHGFGNETTLPGDDNFYKVDQRQFRFEPSVLLKPAQHLAFQVGPSLRWVNTGRDDNANRFIGQDDPPGFGTFGEIGGIAQVTLDTRDVPLHATKGVHISLAGRLYPSAWDVNDTFGAINGSISTYLHANVPLQPTLALRVGGEKLFGSYPYFEAAYLGGAKDVRGFREQRFAGDAALFGNAEARFALGRVNLTVPTQVGLFGIVDVGRVFLEGDPADANAWHTGVGGGLWLSFINRGATLTAAVVSGDDVTGLYVRAGFLY